MLAIVGFTAAICIFAGFVAGNLMGADSVDVREWISALSGIVGGLIAAGVAIWIGITQLKPLLAEQRDKRTQALLQREEICRRAVFEISMEVGVCGESLAEFFMPGAPASLLPEPHESEQEAQVRILKTLEAPYESLDRLQRQITLFQITPESLSELSDAKSKAAVAVNELIGAFTDFRIAVIDKVVSLGETSRRPPSKEDVTFALKTRRSMNALAQIGPKFEHTQNEFRKFYEAIGRELKRVEEELLEKHHRS